MCCEGGDCLNNRKCLDFYDEQELIGGFAQIEQLKKDLFTG